MSSHRRRDRALAGAAVGLIGVALGVVGVPATAALAQAACVQPGNVIKPVPWAQKLLAPERVWPLTTGAGIKIAVLDSGVDAKHPQLGDARVLQGDDFLYTRNGPGNHDCVGHGTAVASLMVAKQSAETGFRGFAPDATVVPVIVSEKEGEDKQSQDSAVTPAVFAEAMRWAVDQKVKVMNLSLAFKSDYPEVRDAVKYAVSKDVVVIAAVGNFGADGNPTPYPAAYDDVIGVGAIDQNGEVLKTSGRGTFVDLVAPGDGIVAATPGHGHAAWSGTSFAAPFVSATAALVRQYYPQLSAKQVAARLLATASPAPGGPISQQYGRGVVDPLRAVTEQLGSPTPSTRPTPIVRSVDPETVEREHEAAHLNQVSLRIGAGAAIVALLALGAMLVRRSGRRQRWNPVRADPVVIADDDPEDAPTRLFDDAGRGPGSSGRGSVSAGRGAGSSGRPRSR